VVAVTAAGAGIGREVALRFAAQGAAVALNDIDEIALADTALAVRALGAPALEWSGDIGDPAAPGRFVASAVAAFGRIDVLHNNAGFSRPSLMVDLTDADWYLQQRVVLDAVAFGIRAALPHMIEQRSGCIVNTASIGGLAGRPASGAYSAFKAAVIRLTEVTALEVARHGVRCVAVAPGAVRTAVLERWLADVGSSPEEYTGNILGRLTEPGEVADVVVWLASEQASAVTGVTLPVNQTSDRA
jgi:NAD(P)-dependent dehydrogenase (short-subunit alcohol dehydrogenase family)